MDGRTNARGTSYERFEEREPLRPRAAAVAVARCVATTARLLARREVRLSRTRVGLRIRFADGTTGRVYRETVVDHPADTDRCVLVVAFRLRAVRGVGHRLFELESLLNTLLFVGFPGYVSKLWLAADAHGVYRGLYEWDRPALAEAYARALWWVLALVSVPGSIHYRVVPGLRRDELLADPALLERIAPERSGAWWRVTGTE
ncbi:MAG TPA: hypothetical protein VFL99_11730 [Segeticoccus sp.]|uniref:hypothetical protein n=1 Tax=Segeticoccus sp. TaxID=2706531 RepID=UPI002D80D225|nr:hypothetical protein [Segeticoccus sp.]HET8600987.1 hypothetical protein [Segeticoccus sp.]